MSCTEVAKDTGFNALALTLGVAAGVGVHFGVKYALGLENFPPQLRDVVGKTHALTWAGPATAVLGALTTKAIINKVRTVDPTPANNDDVEQIRSDLAEAQRKVTDLEREKGELEAAKTAAEQALAANPNAQAVAEATAVRDRAVEDLEATQAQLDAATAEITAKGRSVEQKEEARAALEAEKGQLEGDLATTRAEVQRLTEEVAAKQAEVDAKQGQIDALQPQASAGDAEQRSATLAGEKAVLEQQVATLTREKDEALERAGELEGEKQDLDGQITDLTAELAVAEAYVAGARAQIAAGEAYDLGPIRVAVAVAGDADHDAIAAAIPTHLDAAAAVFELPVDTAQAVVLAALESRHRIGQIHAARVESEQLMEAATAQLTHARAVAAAYRDQLDAHEMFGLATVTNHLANVEANSELAEINAAIDAAGDTAAVAQALGLNAGASKETIKAVLAARVAAGEVFAQMHEIREESGEARADLDARLMAMAAIAEDRADLANVCVDLGIAGTLDAAAIAAAAGKVVAAAQGEGEAAELATEQLDAVLATLELYDDGADAAAIMGAVGARLGRINAPAEELVAARARVRELETGAPDLAGMAQLLGLDATADIAAIERQLRENAEVRGRLAESVGLAKAATIAQIAGRVSQIATGIGVQQDGGNFLTAVQALKAAVGGTSPFIRQDVAIMSGTLGGDERKGLLERAQVILQKLGGDDGDNITDRVEGIAAAREPAVEQPPQTVVVHPLQTTSQPVDSDDGV